jgi:hypothetical protein
MRLPEHVVALNYGAEALVPFTKEVKDLLTKVTAYGDQYQMYRLDTPDSPNAWVPRGLVNRLDTPKENWHLSWAPCGKTVAIKPPQTEDQAGCIERSLALLSEQTDHIVEAPTGFGKTYVGCSVAGQLGQRTLIIVTKNDLVKGWRDTLIHLFGVNPNDIGHVQQDQCKYKNCRFVIAMIHSLVCRDYDTEFYGYFGLTIFDEVHRLGADYFSQVCSKFPTGLRLGLSATPKRGDGKERLFEAHIGPVMVRGLWVPMKPKILVKQTGWKVPIVSQRDDMDGVWKKMPMKVTPGRMMAVTKALASSTGRNQEIAKFVKAAYDAGRHVVVMSDLIEDHLNPLFHLIVQTGIGGQDIGFYHGQVKKQELEVSKTKRVVLATYAMCSEGTNVPHWDTLVLATPRSNVKQAVGRILRLVEGKKQPTILDLVDDHPMLKTFYYSRLKQYYSVGGEAIDV